MGFFDDRFEQHPAHKSLAAALSAYESLLIDDDSDIDADLVAYLSAVESSLKTVQHLLGSVDPQATPINLLDEAQTHGNDLRNRIEQFTATGQQAQVTGVVGAVDALNRVSAALSGIATIGVSEAGIQDAVTSYRRSAGQHIANLSKLADDFRDEMAKVQADLAEHKQSIDEQKSRVDSVISDYQGQFSEAQQARLSEWSQQAKEFNDGFDTQISNANEATTRAVEAVDARSAELLKTIRQESKSALDEIQKRREEANRLIEATAVDAIAADFKSAAAADKKLANRWRAGALVIMLLGIGTVIWLLIIRPTADIDLVDVGRATLVAAAVAAPALYAQRESNKHRVAARESEKFALELNALEPFLANFDDELLEKQIKKEFADQVFGGRGSPDLIEDLEITQSGLVELLKLLAKKL